MNQFEEIEQLTYQAYGITANGEHRMDEKHWIKSILMRLCISIPHITSEEAKQSILNGKVKID